MIQPPKTPEVSYWRDLALDRACLARLRYGAHEFEPHVHDEMVLAVTEDGIGECRTRRGANVSGPGTMWVFAPGEYHCGRVESDRHWFYRGMYLDSTALSGLSNVFEVGTDRQLFVPPGLYFDEHLSNMLLSVHQRLETPETPLMERQSLWAAAMGMLFGRYGKPRPRVSSSSIGRAKLELARDYITAHYSEDVSIDELARLAGVSRYHFMRSFRAEYGMPPHAYLNQVRLIAARHLLTSGRSLAAAAAEVGFYDQSRLNRLFKRTYGITPRQYAKL